MGDRALIVFAEVASTNLRSSDIVGRLGGEEFVAILPNMGAEDAFAAAERVRTAFQAAAAEIDGQMVGATLSAGVAFTTDSMISVDALLEKADDALYVAKASGRNRVEVAALKPTDESEVKAKVNAPGAAEPSKAPILTVVSDTARASEAA